MAPTSSVSRLPSGDYQLWLQGHFPHPHWVAFLFSGLSNLKVSVKSGTAVCAPDQAWNAQFSLDFRASRAVPETLDYLALAQQETSLAFQPPRLSQFQVSRRFDQSLEIRLQGPDQMGFLGRMLVKVALLALFPTELEIETVAGKIQDRLVFRGIGGMPPDLSIEKSLEPMLTAMRTSD